MKFLCGGIEMKFPASHCIPTRYLTKPMYDLLLTKLITDGYHWPSNFDKSLFFDLWSYIGVNEHLDILVMDNPDHYIALHEERWDNVLSEHWLRGYLSE